jgi:hypothetical protein
MMQFSVHVDGIEKLLKDLGIPLKPVLKEITFAAGELVQKEIAVYPGSSHSPVLWASERQRRYYFAMRYAAGLSPKYDRGTDAMSKQLLNAWKVSHHGATDALVDNQTNYGPWVQNEIYQSAQHKATGWITDEKAVKNVEKSGDVERVAEKIIAQQTAFKD